jgi:hypothetical protein
MSIFKNLENSELFAILECSNLKDIIELLGTEELATEIGVNAIEEAPRLKAVKARLIRYSRKHYTAKLKPNLISGALFFSLNDVSSFSFLTLLTIIGNITFPMLALSILTGGFAAASIALSSIFFIAYYKRQKNAIRDAEKFFDFATIKSMCANELIARQKLELADVIEHKHLRIDINHAVKLHKPKIFSYKNKERFLHGTDALAAAVLTGSMLFGTYYLGISSILTAFGVVAASAAMTGGIGLAIAGAVAVGVAIFCFIKVYKSVVNADHIEKLQAHIGEEFEKSRTDCYNLHRKVDELSNIQEHDMPAPKATRSHSDPQLHRRKTFPDSLESATQHSFFMMQRGNRIKHRPSQKSLAEERSAKYH